MSILLPCAVLPPASSTHLEPYPLIGPIRATGRLQCWLVVFAQVATISWMPFTVEWFGSVRHFPVPALTYSLLDRCVQTSRVEVLHGSRAMALLGTAMHQPCTWSWRLSLNVIRCSVAPLQ